MAKIGQVRGIINSFVNSPPRGVMRCRCAYCTVGLLKYGPVVQWIEYLPAGRQGSFLNFRYRFPACRQAGIPVGSSMITVYVIISEMNGDIYVGIAMDVERQTDRTQQRKK